MVDHLPGGICQGRRCPAASESSRTCGSLTGGGVSSRAETYHCTSGLSGGAGVRGLSSRVWHLALYMEQQKRCSLARSDA